MGCTLIPEIDYSEFTTGLYAKAVANCVPLAGSIEVTGRCNLRCVHCYIQKAAMNEHASAHGLSGPDLRRIIDHMVDNGCLQLLITGGEPLVRPDFLDVYTYCKKKGLIITLFTNGTLITPKIVDCLAEYPPFAIEVTLYGSTDATYEKITGVSGARERCLRGIGLILDRGLPLRLKSVVLTLNRHEILEMRGFADKLGVDYRFDTQIIAALDGSLHPICYRLSAEEAISLDQADEERTEILRDSCNRLYGPPPRPDYLHNCAAALSFFHIDPYGFLSACALSRTPCFDLKKMEFHEAWHALVSRVRDEPRSQESPCRNCNLMAFCGNCPAKARMECGHPEKPVPFECRLAQLRAECFLSDGSGKE